jgi:hypothetical protein
VSNFYSTKVGRQKKIRACQCRLCRDNMFWWEEGEMWKRGAGKGLSKGPKNGQLTLSMWPAGMGIRD